jgi:hypothetical protein
VIEKSMHVWHSVEHEIEGGTYAITDVGAFAIATLISNAHRGQTKAGSGDARHSLCTASSGQSAIFHLARGGIGLGPEEIKSRTFNLVEQLIINTLIRWASF